MWLADVPPVFFFFFFNHRVSGETQEKRFSLSQCWCCSWNSVIVVVVTLAISLNLQWWSWYKSLRLSNISHVPLLLVWWFSLWVPMLWHFQNVWFNDGPRTTLIIMFWGHLDGDIRYAAILWETMKYSPSLEGQQWRADSKWENNNGKTALNWGHWVYMVRALNPWDAKATMSTEILINYVGH